MYPTRKPLQEFGVDLLLETFEEHRFNRSPKDYERLIALIPPLKQAYYLANRRLDELHKAGQLKERLICHFKAGDLKPRYEAYPKTISMETLRQGLATVGLRMPKRRKRKA